MGFRPISSGQVDSIKMPTVITQPFKDTAKHIESVIVRPTDGIKPTPITNPIKSEDYINAISKCDVAILIVDVNNNPINSISSSLKELYEKSNKAISISLFTDDFLKSKYLNKLKNGDSKLIEMLRLESFADYIVLGKYSNVFDVNNDEPKYTSRAKLDISIVSCSAKSIIRSFVVNGTNGFDDKQHAENGSIEKIIDVYEKRYLNL
jgi:hypothetical protein